MTNDQWPKKSQARMSKRNLNSKGAKPGANHWFTEKLNHCFVL